MDLLSYGLLGAVIILLNETFSLIKNNFITLRYTWNKLGLNKYKIKDIKRNNRGIELKVKLPIGESLLSIKKFDDKIEKAYGCKCFIEDINFSKYVLIKLEFTEEDV